MRGVSADRECVAALTNATRIAVHIAGRKATFVVAARAAVALRVTP